MSGSIYMLPVVYKCANCSGFSPILYIVRFLHFCQSDGYEVIFHWGLNFHFLVYWKGWTPLYVIVGYPGFCFWEKPARASVFYWSVCKVCLCIVDTNLLSVTYVANIFSQFCGMSFYSHWGIKIEFLVLMKLNISVFFLYTLCLLIFG